MARALAAGDRAGAAEVVRTDSILRTDFVANALVGDREGVIASLRGALDSGAYGGPFGPPNYLWDPVLDPYRNDPQFQELLRSRHLEPRR